MEKIIIKDFGPIRKAELELKKVNVLIGPQGSGKSTIAKVISAVRSYNSWNKEEWVWSDLKTKLEEDYNLVNYFNPKTAIIMHTAEGTEVQINSRTKKITVKPKTVQSLFSESIYIPAERILVPLIAESSFLFIREKTPISKYITEFGLLFQKARSSVKSQKFNFLDGLSYNFEDNTDKVQLKNGKIITLNESSNGIQTILPLLLVISLVTAKSYNKSTEKGISISIEEPELSLFPSTQNDLLEFILEKILPLNYSLTITTHSPYTLTTLNNLMYAYQVGKINSKVDDVIPQKVWLNPEDVGAWFVENGTIRSVVDEEMKQIKAEEIDKISDVLNIEYDKIMDLKFRQ